MWRQDTSRAAEPRATLSRRDLWWALEALVYQHLSVARVADALGVSWNTANDAVLAEGRRVLIDDPHRFDDVQVIDLTPIRDGTGPARLLDMVAGCSKQAFMTAITEELPEAVPVLDPFHVVRLAGDALDQCRRRVQQATHGHRGRTG